MSKDIDLFYPPSEFSKRDAIHIAIRVTVVADQKKGTLQASVRENVESGQTVYTDTLPAMSQRTYDPPLDTEIANVVETLQRAAVETFESCQGGDGHAYPEPTVRFHGDRSEGFRALAAALRAGLSVASLRRIWPVLEGEPTGPWWELTFIPTKANSTTTCQQH